jgi:hypothetical protein
MAESAKETLRHFVVAVLSSTRGWISKIGEVWKARWFGYFLVAASICVLLWFSRHPPPSGIAVTAMAVVAGVMALRPEMSGWEKWFWLPLLLTFMFVEIKAINKDRKDQDDKFEGIVSGLQTTVNNSTAAVNTLTELIKEEHQHFDQTMAGIATGIQTQTGGDSFAFITLTAEPPGLSINMGNFAAPRRVPYFLVSITSHGKFPLRNLHATMMDDEGRLAAMEEYNRNPGGDPILAIQSSDTIFDFPYLRPQSSEAPNGDVEIIRLYPMTKSDSKRLTIAFRADNGDWVEALHMGRINGDWHQCLSVMGPTVRQAKHPFIYCDSDWLEGKALAEKDWSTAATPKKAGAHFLVSVKP